MRRPIGIFYEHPDWFRPLFAELERRAIPFARIDATAHAWDPAAREAGHAVVFNRMSPSAFLRGHVAGIFHAHAYLAYLEDLGVRVVNGSKAYGVETSKARQLALFESLGLPYPRARVINHASRAPGAASDLRFPVVVKANVGGSGAGIVRYETREALAAAASAGTIDLGIDHTALVQEFIPARGGHIVRVEVLDGSYLYAIKVFSTGESFNLCPADICQTTDGRELARGACPVDAPRTGIRVEGCTPPPQQMADVERIVRAAGIDVGGVEYIVDDRDGRVNYYDVNALSNFVADAPRVVGFDPFVRLVDFLDREARAADALDRAPAAANVQ